MSQSLPLKTTLVGEQPNIATVQASGESKLSIFGWPYSEGTRILKLPSVDAFISDPSTVVQSLNGEFCVIAESPSVLVIASDRYVSHPLFYAIQNGEFVYSFEYSVLWSHLKNKGLLTPDKYSIFEFLKFQRLFGTKTLDLSSKMLPPASILRYDKRSGEVSTRDYWTPDFTKRTDSIKSIASDLAEVTRASIKSKISGFKNVGLLLSGGMDSRVVLGGFDQPDILTALTVGSDRNNEVKAAEELASKTRISHQFVDRTPSHYSEILSQSVSVGGAMYSFQHGHFFGLDIPKNIDLLLHGHGFDYMFQGMYLPSRRRSLLGRKTRVYELSTPSSVIDEYFSEAKYQLKGLDVTSLLSTSEIDKANESARSSINAVLSNVEDRVVDPLDAWDYLTVGAPGRHYTFLNLLSAESLAPQQTVAWDNAVFDCYFSTPANVRFGTRLLSETIAILNPALLEVRNANTNLSPKLGGIQLTLASWRRGALRRIGMTTATDPSQDDRSWPSSAQILDHSDVLIDHAENLSKSESLLSLDLFDPTAIASIVSQFRAGQKQLGSAILTLITLDEFLSTKN